MDKKILIIKPSGLGDIIHSLPVAKALKIIYQSCQIHWLVFDRFKDILENVDYIDSIIILKKDEGLKEYVRILNKLRKEDYDLIIDLQVLLRTALLGYLVKFRRVFSTSYVREFSNFFVRPVSKFNSHLHAVERNYQVAEYFAKLENKNIPSPKSMLPWLEIKDDELEAAKKLLEFKKDKKYIMFSLSSRGYHKIWPKENFLELIKMMFKNFKNFIVVFLGSKEEQNIAKWIINNIDNEIEYKNLVGKTNLKELKAILKLSNLTISNDNGVAHISAAVNTPTFIIFGPSEPKWFYPYNDKSGYIYKKLPCSPCGVKTFCKNNICMKQITPNEVFDYILKKFEVFLK